MKTIVLKFLLIPAFFCVSAGKLSAANITWTNASGNQLWSDPANWEPQQVPTSADAAIFPVTINDDGAYEILMDQPQDVMKIIFSGNSSSPVIRGNGHELTLCGSETQSGSISGGQKPVIDAPVHFLRDTTVANGETWGGSITFNAGGRGDVLVRAIGNQNHNVIISNGVWSVTKTRVECASLTVSNCEAKNVTFSVGGNFSNGNGNGTSLTFRSTVDLTGSKIITENNAGALKFENRYDEACENVHEVALEHNVGRLSLYCDYYGGTNLVRFTSAQIKAGTSVRVSYSRKGATSIVHGENAGFFLPENIETETEAGLYSGNFYYDYYACKKNALGSIAPADLSSDYTVFPATGGPYLTDKPYRKNSAGDWTLSENASWPGYLEQYSGDATYALGSFALKISAGSLGVTGSGEKHITAAEGGKIVFATRDVCLFMNGSGAFYFDAPLAWEPSVPVPAGEYPSLVFTGAGKSDVYLAGNDLIQDWKDITAEAGKTMLSVHFGGDIDRRIHGTVSGRNYTTMDGTGTLTFLGPDIRRSGTHRCLGGTTILAHDRAPAPDIITNAVCVVAGGITHHPVRGTSSVYKDGLFCMQGTDSSTTGVALRNGSAIAGGAPGEPGKCTITGTLRLKENPASYKILQKFGAQDTSTIFAQSYYPETRGTRNVVIELQDVSRGSRVIRPEEVFPVISFGKVENFTAGDDTYVLENLSPKALDASAAMVWYDNSKKTVYLTGIRSLHGTLLLIH